MPRITLLPPHIVAKIAAGEVIENPASIVKELVDNAIDAGSSEIRIELYDGGKEKISVKDNGSGMSREDVLLSYHPHTTSKITDEDLLHIHNLGFRGEALASIASVATLTIKSREAESESGTVAIVNATDKPQVYPLGMPVGTEIIVEDLFDRVPARQNFLKDTSTELRACIALITSYALAYPHISFSLIHEEKHIFSLPIHAQTDRVKTLLGQELHEQLIPISHQTEFGTISGFIGTPQTATPFSGHQYLFVNNRVVASNMVAPDIARAYSTLLEKMTHPPFILWLTVPHTHVDMNVHPRKETVRFLYENDILKLITLGIDTTLKAHNLSYKDRPEVDEPELQNREMDTHLARLLKGAQKLQNRLLTPSPVIQVHNVYLVTETPDGLLLIDQHAAHERILYEKFLHTFEHVQAERKIVELPNPIVIELSDEETILLESKQEVFATLGFELEPFGPRTFKVSSVPEIYKNRNFSKLIQEVLHDLVHDTGVEKIDHESKRTLSFLACRSAIKAGDELTEEEARTLIENLSQTTVPYTCPHGRPTHIELSKRDLDKLFKRTI